MARNANGTETRFIIDPNRRIFETVQERINGSAVKSYTYGLDRLLAKPVSGNGEFYLPDRLGSVRQVANENGEVTETNTFDVFGGTSAP